MDKIEIRDLEIFANHGVFPEENVLGQKFVVSAVMISQAAQEIQESLFQELQTTVSSLKQKLIMAKTLLQVSFASMVLL